MSPPTKLRRGRSTTLKQNCKDIPDVTEKSTVNEPVKRKSKRTTTEKAVKTEVDLNGNNAVTTSVKPRGKRSNPEVKTEDESPVKKTKVSNSNNKSKNSTKTNTKSDKKSKAEIVDSSIPKSKAKNSKGKAKNLSTKSADNNIKLEDEDEPKSKTKGKDTKSQTKSKKKVNGSSTTERKAVERVFVKKGGTAVDGLCPIAASSHVYSEGADVWDCMLNQTNIEFNNNKYYLIQLLKDDSKNAYSVWMRWGRVGNNGQNTLKPFGSNLEAAKNTFTQKFYAKTLNDWEMRQDFEKIPGKYDLLQMDYSDMQDTVDSKTQPEKEIKELPKLECKLSETLRLLIELICDLKTMEQAVAEMKFDAQKAPLGKLTADQVKLGYQALKNIEDIITGSDKFANKDLVRACNLFYTRIPHYFGMKVPPLIRTKRELQEKVTLLQTLADIEAAMSIINQPQDASLHPADQHYYGLECDIEPLPKDHDEFKLLDKYMKSTHGKTHTMYKLETVDIFKLHKNSEEPRFKDVGNRMLLWHGSRLANWAGILSQGLKIAPPEAPVTGYMFGKGIYFADMSSKSANYCMPSYQNKTGLLVLCEVALGKSKELLNGDYEAHKFAKDHDSIKGLGRIAPDPTNFVTMSDGVLVPMGPPKETHVVNDRGYTLQYNEYIVYNVAQVKMRYLIKVNFQMK